VVGDAPKERRAARGGRRIQVEMAERTAKSTGAGRAQDILGQIAAVDQAIAGLKEDIKKYGSGGLT